jgi:hypothetical protein
MAVVTTTFSSSSSDELSEQLLLVDDEEPLLLSELPDLQKNNLNSYITVNDNDRFIIATCPLYRCPVFYIYMIQGFRTFSNDRYLKKLIYLLYNTTQWLTHYKRHLYNSIRKLLLLNTSVVEYFLCASGSGQKTFYSVVYQKFNILITFRILKQHCVLSHLCE